MMEFVDRRIIFRGGYGTHGPFVPATSHASIFPFPQLALLCSSRPAILNHSWPYSSSSPNVISGLHIVICESDPLPISKRHVLSLVMFMTPTIKPASTYYSFSSSFIIVSLLLSLNGHIVIQYFPVKYRWSRRSLSHILLFFHTFSIVNYPTW